MSETTIEQSGLSQEQQQQEQLLDIMSICLLVGGVSYAIISLVMQSPEAFWDAVGGAGIALSGGLSYALTRRNLLRPASWVMVGLLVLFPGYYTFFEGPKAMGLLLFPASIIFADLLIGGRSGIVVAAIDILVYTGIGLAHEYGWIDIVYTSPFITDLGALAIICGSLALATGFFTRGLRQALRQAQERERALQVVGAEKNHLLEELHRRENAQHYLLETIREMGSPVIPLAEGIIAMPLIGTIDSERASRITQTLLQGVAEQRARTVLVDITGVPLVDTAVASALIRAMTGVRLLGAEPILVGIRTEVAQTIVDLGLDLRGIVIRSNMQTGLAYALQTAEKSVESGQYPLSQGKSSSPEQGDRRTR